ncbi:related to triose phosphate/3-phosphoglycerate/phosphate translocator [Cephalotrichum gorgonifer]|uniref:Related to triose phosphate/3-phosphoglycerate/phosphate translocator n=1 Tax=Cephalotrichum gorgonifer TaxID=2041049 RepID=A0AAE8N5X6_9PEZI|nr:related to triose phosphate/3-phosphoglycerate/phosphate translocator [Cephalotrichum gorgonifer]
MSGLPTTEKPSVGGKSLHPVFYIASWMFFSNTTILFNKKLIHSGGFPYPIILTCWHLIFATLATQVLSRTTSLLDGRHKVKMTQSTYIRAVVPIGVLFSGSLVCSNLVYLYLNVAFIQMLKAAGPVAVLAVSYLWGVSTPTFENIVNVVGITAGVALASAGEIQFSWVGFLFQAGGIVFEALRLVMIQVLLSGEDMKMDPLVSLYYFAPVCAVMNIFVALVYEASSFRVDAVFEAGVWTLFLNALVAFMLNVASVFLIGKTSSLVLTLAGILKAILLVAFSVLVYAEVITFLQFVGYSIALFGLLCYSLGWAQLKTLTTTAHTRASASLGSPSARRAVSLTLVFFIVLMLFFGFQNGGGEVPAAVGGNVSPST